MTQLGNIQLPLFKPVKVNGSDLDILDMIFDMKILHMNEVLTAMQKAGLPSILVIHDGVHKLIGVMIFKPPDIWLDFDHQQYQLFLAPNIQWMIHYWVDRKMKSQDVFEVETIQKVIDHLENHKIRASSTNIT